MKLVVFHLISSLNTGGAETMLMRLVVAMPYHKHVVVSLTDLGPVAETLAAAGHPVYCLNLNIISFPFALVKLGYLLKKYKPNVMQTWMYHSDLIGGLMGKICGISNIVWNVRNTEISQSGISTTKLIIKLCALFSKFLPNKIICCAESAKIKHIALGYDDVRMTVIPNGFDPDVFFIEGCSKAEIRSAVGLPSDGYIIGIVGRFDRLKGYDVFLKAAGFFSDNYSYPVTFVLVGRGISADNAVLQNWIHQYGSAARFCLLGESLKVSKILQAFDVYCLSSYAEGFPNVVAEAMLMETPCVVTNVGDAAAMVGDTGVVVASGDHVGLAKGWLKILTLGDVEREKIGHMARKRIINLFSIGKVAARYNDIYRQKGPGQ